jgi:uncharacterized protein YidB (DUF937 family)
MGILDELGKAVGGSTGGAASGGTAALIQQITGMLGGGAGLTGLVKTFTDKGLGSIVGSWVGTGANLPISPQQVTQALGADQISQMAAKAGLDPNTVAQHVSQVLPGLVDKLTPNGQIPDAATLAKGLSALKGLLG